MFGGMGGGMGGVGGVGGLGGMGGMGGGFGGVLGMFLGVPVFACIQELVKFLMDRRLQRRDMPTEAYAYVGRAKDTKAKETEEDAKHDA